MECDSSYILQEYDNHLEHHLGETFTDRPDFKTIAFPTNNNCLSFWVRHKMRNHLRTSDYELILVENANSPSMKFSTDLLDSDPTDEQIEILNTILLENQRRNGLLRLEEMKSNNHPLMKNVTVHPHPDDVSQFYIRYQDDNEDWKCSMKMFTKEENPDLAKRVEDSGRYHFSDDSIVQGVQDLPNETGPVGTQNPLTGSIDTGGDQEN